MPVVEDEERFRGRVQGRGLEAEGFGVDVAPDDVDGPWPARENACDAIVLGIVLPRLNGYRVRRAPRGEVDRTPVLVLAAREDEWDAAPARLTPDARASVRSPLDEDAFLVLAVGVRTALR